MRGKATTSILAAIILLGGSALGQQADHCAGSPVQHTIKLPVGEGDTPEYLRQLALLQAQTEIIQEYCGSDVSSTTVVEDSMLASHRVLDITRGLITSLKALDRGHFETIQGKNGEEFNTFVVKVEAVPMRIQGTADPEFTVAARMDKDAYSDGDAGILTGTLTQAAYVYVFNISSDSSVALVFPTRVNSSNQFPPGDFRLFADDKPLRFASDPKQQSKRLREFMVVLATKKPLDLSGSGIKEAVGRPLNLAETGTSIALARAILKLKRDEIAQAAASYELYRKPAAER